MKRIMISLVLLVLSYTSAFGGMLYDNTAVDTLNTLFYSVGPYAGIGDQVELTTAAQAGYARLQFFNAGGPGTFDVDLHLYQAGAPVGAHIATFTETGVASTGFDIIDVLFSLGGLPVPQHLVFMASVNASGGMDLGLNLFEPPTVGVSDGTFLMVDTGTISQAVSSNENVYFQITSVPEPATILLLGAGLAVCLLLKRQSKHANHAVPALRDS